MNELKMKLNNICIFCKCKYIYVKLNFSLNKAKMEFVRLHFIHLCEYFYIYAKVEL